MKIYDTVIVGGGQAGLSVAYFLRRGKVDYLILDDKEEPGGSWLDTWDSLRLFSPVQYSSLSGWPMPKGNDEYPSKDEFIEYLKAYEARYNFPIERPVKVKGVTKEMDLFKIESDKGTYFAKTLVSATGTAQTPYLPEYPNRELFEGTQIHSKDYRSSEEFEGSNVLIIGAGNSGAQILAEVSKVADTKWITLKEPHFLPDDIDGRYLFTEATRKYRGNPSTNKSGGDGKQASLSDIVVVPAVKEALERDVYEAFRPFDSFYEDGIVWANGDKEKFDAVIWCTGFKANLQHLAALDLHEGRRIKTRLTRSVKEPNLWLVGYGGWTGFASATIYGVGKTARQTGAEIIKTLKKE